MGAVYAGRLVNEIRELAAMVDRLPMFTPDPLDNYLLAMAAAGAADFLVTGNKRDLLPIKLFHGAKIVTVRIFFETYRQLP